jgi:hypothetical protein
MSRARPSIATLIVVATLGIGFILVALSLPIDDFWLSIASGRAIAAGADPRSAIELSWLPVAAGALNPQWLAQVVLGGHGSVPIALAVNSALIATGLVVTLVRAATRVRDPRAAAIAMLLVIAALSPHLLARAQSFSIALFPIALLILERGRGRFWQPVAYGLLMVAWANLHGAFVIGVLAAFTWLVGSALDRRTDIGISTVTAAIALIAPLVNPVGLDLLGYALNQPGSDVVRSISVEWQTAWPWIPVAAPFWVVLAGVAVGRAVRGVESRRSELLLLALLAALAISGIRHIPWFLLATAPLLASDIEAGLARLSTLNRALGTIAPNLAARAGGLAVALALAATGFQLIRPAMPSSIARLTPDEPVLLVDRLAEELPAQCCMRILNEQVWGGYLAYRLADRALVAIDGRLEIRSVSTWAAYFDLLHGEGDPASSLQVEQVGWAILGTDRDTLRDALESAGWTIVQRADHGILMRAPAGRADSGLTS